MTEGRKLTVDARRGVSYDHFWWVFIETDKDPEATIRRVHSLDEVRSLINEFGCTATVWTNGAYEEMVASGVAPEVPPAWLRPSAPAH